MLRYGEFDTAIDTVGRVMLAYLSAINANLAAILRLYLVMYPTQSVDSASEPDHVTDAAKPTLL